MVSSLSNFAASAFPTDLPPLSPRDAELLASLLELRLNLTALATKHNLPALDLIHWAASPSIRSYIRALREVTDDCTRIRQSQARRSAVDTLETIAVLAEDPIEKRRAASSLLRSEHPRRAVRTTPSADNPETAAVPADPRRVVSYHNTPRADGLDEPVLPPEYFGPAAATQTTPPIFKFPPESPKVWPSPSLAPEELVLQRVRELRTGARTRQAKANLFPFLTPGALVFNIPTPDDVNDFISLHHMSYLSEIVNASHGHTTEISRTQTAATITVSLLSGIHTLCPGLRVELERRSMSTSQAGPHNASPHQDCWLITRIDQEQVPWRHPLPELPPMPVRPRPP